MTTLNLVSSKPLFQRPIEIRAAQEIINKKTKIEQELESLVAFPGANENRQRRISVLACRREALAWVMKQGWIF